MNQQLTTQPQPPEIWALVVFFENGDHVSERCDSWDAAVSKARAWRTMYSIGDNPFERAVIVNPDGDGCIVRRKL